MKTTNFLNPQNLKHLILTPLFLFLLVLGTFAQEDFTNAVRNSKPFNNQVFNQGGPVSLNGALSFYMIMESTKAEYVSVGSNGNILRWGSTGGNEQKWCIYPVMHNGKVKYRIQSLANKEFMSVGSNGNVLRWGKTSDNSQLFEFKKVRRGVYNIVESTKGEHLAVGWNGNITRWAPSGGKEQEFILLPIEFKALANQPKFSRGVTAYEANRIPQVKYVYNNNTKGLPPMGKKYLISEDIVPANLVNDPNYSTKIDQMRSNPFYYLVRRQYYMPNHTDVIPGRKVTTIEENHYQFSQTDINEITQTLSAGLESTASISYKGATASLKSHLDYTVTKKDYHERSSSSSYSITKKVELNSPASIDTRIVKWQLVDEYTLYDKNGRMVPNAQWKSDAISGSFEKSYPELPFKLY